MRNRFLPPLVVENVLSAALAAALIVTPSVAFAKRPDVVQAFADTVCSNAAKGINPQTEVAFEGLVYALIKELGMTRTQAVPVAGNIYSRARMTCPQRFNQSLPPSR